MRRREFILATAALLAQANRLWADHHTVSAEPLVVEFDLGSLEGRYTRVEDFYVRNHYDAPGAAPASLRIEGEVRKPLEITPESLKPLRQQEIGAVLECAGDPVKAVSLVSDGVWQGWSLGEIVSLARPKSAGSFLHLFGRDGFSRSVPAERAMTDGLLAASLNGRPLFRNHGAPWRALFPGWYGMDSVKWLAKIVVASSPLPPVGNTYLEITKGPSGALEKRPLPRVQVKSVITRPASGAVLPRGAIAIHGLAWSGCGKITKVDVSTDSGANWQPATLNGDPSRYDWILWSATLELRQPGVVEFMSQASDSAGNIQPAAWNPRRADLYAYNACGRVRCVVI